MKPPSRLIDLKGRQYGRLVVLSRCASRPRSSGHSAYWNCLCECGSMHVASSGNLKAGTVTSCGCYRNQCCRDRAYKKKKEHYGKASPRRVYSRYQRSASLRCQLFQLSYDEFLRMTAMRCCYCGVMPSKKQVSHSGNGDYVYNGIDRVDNSKGYIAGNMVPCCETCNRAKLEMSESEFREWINRVYTHMTKVKG